MASHSKLISAKNAKELLAQGDAVVAGSAEHRQIMAALWQQVARKFVFVVVAGKWFYRDSGADRVPIQEAAAQRKVNQQFHSDKLVLTYGCSTHPMSASKKNWTNTVG
jgi:hypothetical protein